MNDRVADGLVPRPIRIMRNLGLEPDPWQAEVLTGCDRRLLLNCSRQAGKSTVVAVLALVEAMFVPGTLVLLLSRSLRQSAELFRRVAEFHSKLHAPLLVRRTAHELELDNRSRIISLPCEPDTVRGYASVSILVIDEASRVPDELYRAVRPMLAVSGGRLICLSTPHGQRGFFYEVWAAGGEDWKRIEVPAGQVPRITAAHLEEERQALSTPYFRQEYECSFEALEGLVYPDLARCVVAGIPPQDGRWVGGVDFGFTSPFAALWGVHDRDDNLWLVGEHYCRDQPLSYHIEHLPRHVRWWADPSGAGLIDEMRRADFRISKGNNDIEHGIQAVHARLQTGRLRILQGCCPQLLAEAQLYRYETDELGRRTGKPLKEHDHALDALRYLISGLDVGFLARVRKRLGQRQVAPNYPVPTAGAVLPRPERKYLSIHNEALWTPLFTVRREE
jgi:hypothetical protein